MSVTTVGGSSTRISTHTQPQTQEIQPSPPQGTPAPAHTPAQTPDLYEVQGVTPAQWQQQVATTAPTAQAQVHAPLANTHGPAPAQAQAPNVWQRGWNALNGAADRLGGAVRSGGALVEQGGRFLETNGIPGGSALKGLGTEAREVGRSIQDAPEAAAATAGQVQQRVQDLADRGQRMLGDLRNSTDRRVQEGVQYVQHGLDSMTQGVQQFGRDVAEAVDYGRNIQQLGPGDRYTIAAGGNVTAEGAKVYGKGNIDVARTPEGRYRVSVDGELGGGLYGEVGGSVGARLHANAEATLGVGGRFEMTFNTPEEAQRATGIALRQAAVGAAGAALPGAGAAAQALAGPSAEDFRFLREHASAVELRGSAAAGVSGALGLPTGTNFGGVFGSATVRAEQAVRLEFNAGRPPDVVLRDTLSGDVMAGVGPALGRGGAFGAPGLSANGRAQLQVQHERRVSLPEGVDVAALQRDPAGTVRAAAGQLAHSQQDTVRATLDVAGNLAGRGGGMRTELSLTGRGEDILASGALQRLGQGDVEGALRQVGDHVTGTAAVTPYQTYGVALSPVISVMGFGAGLDARALRTDMLPEQGFRTTGALSAAADGLAAYFQR